MNKLQAILDRCKCGVFLTVNEHRNYYETVEEYVTDIDERFPREQPDVFARMVELDTVVELQFYRNTPVGFDRVFHYDVDAALDASLRALGLAGGAA